MKKQKKEINQEQDKIIKQIIRKLRKILPLENNLTATLNGWYNRKSPTVLGPFWTRINLIPYVQVSKQNNW